MSLPQRHHCDNTCQRYRYLVWCWCITHITDQLELGSSPEPEPVDISCLDTEISTSTSAPQTANNTLFAAHIDPDRATTADITKPIYLARLTHPTRPSDHIGIRPINGWHRIYRARSEGRTHLPGILVPDPIAQAASRAVLV